MWPCVRWRTGDDTLAASGRPVSAAGIRARRTCLLYTSAAADERSSVDLGGRRIIKKKKKNKFNVVDVIIEQKNINENITKIHRDTQERKKKE